MRKSESVDVRSVHTSENVPFRLYKICPWRAFLSSHGESPLPDVLLSSIEFTMIEEHRWEVKSKSLLFVQQVPECLDEATAPSTGNPVHRRMRIYRQPSKTTRPTSNEQEEARTKPKQEDSATPIKCCMDDDQPTRPTGDRSRKEDSIKITESSPMLVAHLFVQNKSWERRPPKNKGKNDTDWDIPTPTNDKDPKLSKP